MERLVAADLERLSSTLLDLYEPCRPDDFPARAIAGVERLAGSDLTTYNEIDGATRRAMRVVPEMSTVFKGSEEAFQAHVSEHPVIAHYAATGDGRPMKISDFVPRAALHRLGLYQEVYRRIPVEHQIAVTLPSTASAVVGIALNRDKVDYSERDRTMLTLIRPHLARAWANAQLLAVAAEAGSCVVIDSEGRILASSEPSERLLKSSRTRVPDVILDWLHSREASVGVPPPLVIDADGWAVRRTLVRCAGRSVTGSWTLVVKAAPPSVPSGKRTRLTAREDEVLSRVAEGKTNKEIAEELRVRPRTVGKHLERIYEKLDVRTRSAAARFAGAPRYSLLAPASTSHSIDWSERAGVAQR